MSRENYNIDNIDDMKSPEAHLLVPKELMEGIGDVYQKNISERYSNVRSPQTFTINYKIEYLSFEN